MTCTNADWYTDRLNFTILLSRQVDQNKVNLWLHCIIVLKLLLSGYSNVYTELSRRFVGKEGDFQPHCFQLWCITFLREGGWLSTVMHHLPVRGRGKTSLGNCRKQRSYDVNSFIWSKNFHCLKVFETSTKGTRSKLYWER